MLPPSLHECSCPPSSTEPLSAALSAAACLPLALSGGTSRSFLHIANRYQSTRASYIHLREEGHTHVYTPVGSCLLPRGGHAHGSASSRCPLSRVLILRTGRIEVSFYWIGKAYTSTANH